jgi:hypothetical protein
MIRKPLIILVKLISSLVLFTIFLCGLIYIQTSIYTFPKAEKFSGNRYINPYQDVDSLKPLKCNLHAHTHAWGGLTNGHNTDEELTKAYVKKGYQVAGISNYHHIEPEDSSFSPIYIPVYEHGINIFKSHKQGINAQKPSYFDFPLWQNTSQKQQIINDIRANGGIVAINHPKFTGGHTIDDMQQLAGYQFVEVLNHYRISDEYWDAALSAGRLVYGVGNDDTHDIYKEPTFKMWTEVYADSHTAEGVLSALERGKSFLVHADGGERDINLLSVENQGDTITAKFTGPVTNVKLWTDNHRLVSTTIYNGNQDTTILKYAFPQTDGFTRLEVMSGNCTIYLNPIVRSTDGKTAGIAAQVPTINMFQTWLYRLIVLCLEIGVVVLFIYVWGLKPFKR